MRRAKWIVAVILTAAVAVAATRFPLLEWLGQLVAWLEGLGPWGPVLFVFVYIAACILCLPGSPLSMAAGFVFGLPLATVAVSVGSVLGATAAFLLARTIARATVERRLAASPRFAAFDRSLRATGFRMVFLIRLSPAFPFNLLNYAFGLTPVSVRDYVVASWLAMLPGTVMYVYLGTTFRSLAEVFSGTAPPASPAQKALFFIGLLATVLLTLLITRQARAALAAEAPHSDQPPS